MPELYERLTGTESERVGNKIPTEIFFSVVSEQQAGGMTQAQALNIIHRISADIDDPLGPLSALAQQEVADLIATIPGGNTSAQIGNRAQKLNEIQRVISIAEQSVPMGLAPLGSTAAVRARLGVPTR